MKLHLPLGLLAALMAAMPIAQGAKTKTFHRENVNITGLWEKDETRDGWLHLDLTQLPGLPNGLSRNVAWVVNFVIKNHGDNFTFGSVKSLVFDQTTQIYDRDNFSVSVNPNAVLGELEVGGYGWSNGSSHSWDGYTLYPSKGYDLVWNPDGTLNSKRYGDVRDKVGFFWSGTANASGDSGSMFYQTATRSLGPSDSWQGLTDLYASTQDTEDTSWLQVTVSYAYVVTQVNEYVVGGAGKLKSGNNGGQKAGGPGLYEVFSSDKDDPDNGELVVADQYGVVGDEKNKTVGDLYGSEHGTTWNKLRFMAAGTQRRFDGPDLPEPPPADASNKKWEQYREDREKAIADYNATMEGSSTVGAAGVVEADFAMYLGGIVVGKNTGNYTLVAPSFTFGDLEEEDDYAIRVDGGTRSFTLRAGDNGDGVIDWGEETSHLNLSVAAGGTLLLEGAGGEGRELEEVRLHGGGTVKITDKTIFGSSGDIYVEREWNVLPPDPDTPNNISGGSTLDLNHNNLSGAADRTIYLKDSACLANAEELTASVEVSAGRSHLGGLDGQRLKKVVLTQTLHEDDEDGYQSGWVHGIGEGSTVTFTGSGDQFAFVVGTENITSASQGAAPSPGGTYLLQFNGSGGSLSFGSEDANAQVKFYLTNDLIATLKDEDYVGGYVDLWFSNGSFSDLDEATLGDAAKLQAWFESHFKFGDGVLAEIDREGLLCDIVSGNMSEKNGGILRLLINTDGIWLGSLYGDVRADQLEETLDSGEKKWKRVIVDKNMTLSFTDDGKTAEGETTTGVTLTNLSSGIGTVDGGVLTIDDRRADPGEQDLTVTLQQEEDEEDPDMVYNLGGLDVKNNTITVVKDRAADLRILGNLTSAGEVKVSEGKLVVNGWESSIAKLGDFGDKESEAELVINGALAVTSASDPRGNGTISGSGILIVKDSLDVRENKLNGVAVWLDKKSESSEDYGSITLGSNFKGDSDLISGLFSGDYSADQALASGETGGHVKLDGNLTIDSTDSNVRMANFYGTFDESSKGVIAVTGPATRQVLRSTGDDGVDLAVEGGACLALTGLGDSLEKYVQKVNYGMVSVSEGSTLAVQASDYGADCAAVTQLNADRVRVSESGTLEVLYNLAAVNDDLAKAGAAVATENFAWEEGAKLFVGTVGSNPYAVNNPQDVKDYVIIEDQYIEGLELNQELELELGGSFLIYWKNVEATYRPGTGIVLNAEANFDNIFSGAAANKQNSLAGADMLWAARQTAPMTSQTEMLKMMVWAANNLQSNPEKVAQTLAGVAGSAAPILGTAQRDALRSQMLRMRDRAGMMGLDESYAYESLPYTHFWVEATGDFINVQDGDDYEPGYTYNAWGGTLGLEMDVTENASVAAGITALYGNLDGGCADTADGNLDSYYLSLMGRFTRRRWGHTLVGVLGLNQAKLTRTVNYGDGFYRAHGSTSGWVAGLLYEATYDIPLDMEQTRIVQPLFAASVMKTNMRGYEESGLEGQGVGLNVGEQDWTTTTLAIGARYITSVGEEAFNRTAQLELRANIAQDFGDSQGEVSTSLQALPSLTRSVKGAEVGKTALQLGASLRVPISDQTLIYFNAGADIRDAMTAWNLGVGARYDF